MVLFGMPNLDTVSKAYFIEALDVFFLGAVFNRAYSICINYPNFLIAMFCRAIFDR